MASIHPEGPSHKAVRKYWCRAQDRGLSRRYRFASSCQRQRCAKQGIRDLASVAGRKKTTASMGETRISMGLAEKEEENMRKVREGPGEKGEEDNQERA